MTQDELLTGRFVHEVPLNIFALFTRKFKRLVNVRTVKVLPCEPNT